jgi:5-enolpyruvylshikimate-3-phosphate synthase
VVIRGCPTFRGRIEVDGCGDHRVIMMLSIVAMRCRKGLAILGAEHVAKILSAMFRRPPRSQGRNAISRNNTGK